MSGLVVIAQSAGASGFDTFLTKLVDGLALGAIYALLAVGFVIIFKATQVLSFAHGAIAAAGAYLVAYTATVLNIPGRWIPDAPVALQWAISVLAGMLLGALVGIVIERIFIRPMIGEPLFSIAMITIGLDIVLRTILDDLLGQGGNLSVGSPFEITSVSNFDGIIVPHSYVASIAVAVVVVGTMAYFFRTRLGIAMRATAFDQEAAMAQGISAGRIFAIAWGIGAALAALGGVFASIPPRGFGVNSTTAFVAFRAFPAIIVGGLDSIVGSVVGGLLIGVIEVMAGHYLASFTDTLGIGFNTIVGYLVMMLVLLVRPYGLFGTEEIRRV